MVRLAATALVHVALLSSSAHTSPAMLQQTAAALTRYAHTVVRRYWHVDAVVAPEAKAPPGWERIRILDWQRPYGGEHSVWHGTPFARVFWEGCEWTQFLASHELAEMLVDPLPGISGRPEVADPVQFFGRKIDGVWVSDIITPRGRDAFGDLP